MDNNTIMNQFENGMADWDEDFFRQLDKDNANKVIPDVSSGKVGEDEVEEGLKRSHRKRRWLLMIPCWKSSSLGGMPPRFAKQ